jgi:hypothetical protein
MSPLRSLVLAAAAAVGLGGCVYDGYGSSVGVSVGYGGYGGYGYGNRYCDPYWDDCYYGSRRGLRYDPWYGWYDGFYYPGTGFYVFDRWGGRRQWSDHHRRYWEGRRHRWGNRDWDDPRWHRWDGFRGDRRHWRGRDGRDWRDRDERGWRSRDRRGWSGGRSGFGDGMPVSETQSRREPSTSRGGRMGTRPPGRDSGPVRDQ